MRFVILFHDELIKKKVGKQFRFYDRNPFYKLISLRDSGGNREAAGPNFGSPRLLKFIANTVEIPQRTAK